MRSVEMLQTQISAIMDVLAKAAVAEISQLLEEDAAALHHEIRRRNEEIRGLKTRLLLTETELHRLSADRCSVAVQVEIPDTRKPVLLLGPGDGAQEKDLIFTEDKPHRSLGPEPKREDPAEPEEEELAGLELEMKIEQVEELVEQKDSGASWSWRACGDPETLSEQRSRVFPDPIALTEDSEAGALQGSSGLFSFGFEYSAGADPPGHERTDPLSFSLPKPFRCEQCGKSFTQRMRLITHRRVHTGEKPFRCQLCGKTFSRQDNCLRHVRLHSGHR